MFCTPEDIYTVIYEEKVEAISREDEKPLDDAIRAAVAEVGGYLGRYDLDGMLEKEDDERDFFLLSIIKTVAAWHFITLANVGVDYNIFRQRYEDAIEYLEKIQAGKASPRHWPPAPVDPITGNDPSGVFKFGSNPKRQNHF